MLKRIISMLLVFCIVFTLTACTGGTSKKYNAGNYTGSAQGFGGTIEVTVTVDSSKITAIPASAEKETQGIGDKAIETLTDEIIKKGSSYVDTV